MEWREARLAEGLAGLGAEMGRIPTDRERAAYLAGWLYAIERRIGAAQEECECRPAVAKYNEPSTPPELARVLRTFLLETFDASPMTGRLDNGAAFEVGIGIYDSEMTVAVLSQSVWFRVRDSLNAAIRADLR